MYIYFYSCIYINYNVYIYIIMYIYIYIHYYYIYMYTHVYNGIITEITISTQLITRWCQKFGIAKSCFSPISRGIMVTTMGL
jgi:hypothetical protein